MIRRLLELLKLVKPRQPHLPQTNVIRSVCEHEFAVHPRFGDLYCTKCYMPKGLIKQTDV
jgi:hypothetical protein